MKLSRQWLRTARRKEFVPRWKETRKDRTWLNQAYKAAAKIPFWPVENFKGK